MTPIRLRSDIGVRLVQHVGSDSSIVAAARVSIEGADSARHFDAAASSGLIRYLMRSRHGSCFEHSQLTFLIEAPIFVVREWQRHRIGIALHEDGLDWSFNETSARYRDLEPVFWVPPRARPLLPAPNYRSSRPEFVAGSDHHYELTQKACSAAYSSAWDSYMYMLASGVAREVARAVLPVAVYSPMYATTNPRSLMHFLSLRTHDASAAHVSYPQSEIEDAARQMEAHFAALFPITYSAFNEFGRVAP